MLAATVNGNLRRVSPGWIYLAGLIPLAWIVWLAVSNGLGVDPVKEIEHRLGKVALWFLMGGLAITPARKFLGLNLIRYRRAVGLIAFFYLCLHLTAWVVLDMTLLWEQALRDLVKRPYLYLGLAGFVAMIPLAVTSNNASVRKLGRNWRRLHWLVYPAVGLGVIHYLMQMKVVSAEGWAWAGAFTALMVARLVPATRPTRG